MRWVVACMALAVLAVPVLAQVQPFSPVDPAGYTVREDLAAAGDLAGAKRVLRFVQVSDAHILDDDAPFPLRQEPLDAAGAPVDAAQRPQEEYTDEVLHSIVQAINAQHADDAFQFVLNTGDNIDNDLENELLRFLDLYDGSSTVTGPVSGFACRPDGQSTGLDDTSHDVTDACTSLPEALAANNTGLAAGLPWYSAFGNHDALIQGNVNVYPSFQEIAAQSGRRFVAQTEYVDMHFAGADGCPSAPAGSPADDYGHGYAYAGARLCDDDPDNDGYYAFSVNGVRFLVLDTVNDDFVTGNSLLQGQFNPQQYAGADIIGGYAEGSIDPAQAAWLDAEIAANPDQLIVVASHHTVNSMFTNLGSGQCAPNLGCLADLLQLAGYKTGEQLLADFAQHPNVVAWVGGHTHRHRIQPKMVEGAPSPGFWNIESSSLIDWPQQARAIELWVTADGGKGFWRLTSFNHTFQLSKDLEQTDAQRVPAGSGTPQDQDVLLWFDVPAGVALTPQPEVARQWRLDLHAPQRDAAGNHGVSGRPLNVSFALQDQTGRPLARQLRATWHVAHQPPGGADIAAIDAEGELAVSYTATGAYLTGSFTPPHAATYYVTVAWGENGLVGGDAVGDVDVESQMFSLSIEDAGAGKAGKGNGIPLSTAIPLAALALGLALWRRRGK